MSKKQVRQEFVSEQLENNYLGNKSKVESFLTRLGDSVKLEADAQSSLGNVVNVMKELEAKISDLDKRGEYSAEAAAMKIYNKLAVTLNSVTAEQWSDENRLKLQSEFATRLATVTTDALKGDDAMELAKHRGAKQILANLALVVFTALTGLIGLGATAKKRGGFWLKPDTDTKKILDGLKSVADKFNTEIQEASTEKHDNPLHHGGQPRS